jgi:hypothetical protein
MILMCASFCCVRAAGRSTRHRAAVDGSSWRCANDADQHQRSVADVTETPDRGALTPCPTGSRCTAMVALSFLRFCPVGGSILSLDRRLGGCQAVLLAEKFSTRIGGEVPLIRARLENFSAAA